MYTHTRSQPYSNNLNWGPDTRGCTSIIAFHRNGYRSIVHIALNRDRRRIESIDRDRWETKSLNRIEEAAVGENNDSKGLLEDLSRAIPIKRDQLGSVITAKDVLRSQGDYARDMKADESVSIVSRMNPVRKYVSGLRKSEIHRLQRGARLWRESN